MPPASIFSISMVPLGFGRKSANVTIFAQDPFPSVGDDEAATHYVWGYRKLA